MDGKVDAYQQRSLSTMQEKAGGYGRDCGSLTESEATVCVWGGTG